MIRKNIIWKKESAIKEQIDYYTVMEIMIWAFINTLLCLIISFSAVIMAQSMIEEVSINGDVIWKLGFFVFLCSIANDYIKMTSKPILRHIFNFGSLGILILWGLHLFSSIGSKLLMGGAFLSERYINLFNSYYGTSYIISGNTSTIQVATTIGFVFTLVVWLEIFIVLESERTYAYVILPTAILISMLVVGKGPSLLGAVIFIISATMVLSENWWKERDIRKGLFLFAFITIVMVFSGIAFRSPAIKIAENNEKSRQFMKQIETMVERITHGETDIYAGEVGNIYPKYKNEIIYSVLYDSAPITNAYLKQMDAETYRNNKWEKDPKVTSYENKLYDFLFFQGINRLKSKKFNGELSYNHLEIEAVEKDLYCDIYPYFLCHALKPQQTSYKASFIDIAFVKLANNKKYRSMVTASPEIQKYLSNFLAVPKGQKTAKKIARKLLKKNATTNNMSSIDIANEVATYLGTNYKYTTLLTASGKQDPVEYFLNVSEEGFCVHFASAGVFILRSMGIPSRYVTGYSLPKERISKKAGKFQGKILDSYKHAWVEIYDFEYGWIPIEMTPGWVEGNNVSEDEILKRIEEKDQIQEWREKSKAKAEQLKLREEYFEQQEKLYQEKKDKFVKYGSIFIIFLLLITISIIRIHKRNWIKQKNIYLIEEDYKMFILHINRRIYLELKLKNPKEVHGNLSDRDFVNLLYKKSQYITKDTWHKYLECIRKVTFSNEEVNKEDADFVWKVYCSLNKKIH